MKNNKPNIISPFLHLFTSLRREARRLQSLIGRNPFKQIFLGVMLLLLSGLIVIDVKAQSSSTISANSAHPLSKSLSYEINDKNLTQEAE
jgi:hypothetical protein